MKKDKSQIPQNIESQNTDIKSARHFITGGAGFIGSHLAGRLLKEGNNVTVYDNLVTGKRQWIENYIGSKGFQFIQADLLDFEVLKKAMEGHDIIWHLGANTDNVKGNQITDLDLKNCTTATYNVLEAMKQNSISELLFSSSATVYGDTPPIALPEIYGPLLPICLYGAGKLACEGLISAYCHLFGFRACIFRFGNVVGGKMWHGVIYDFIEKLKKNPCELEILGDGNQEKNYFLVEDCIQGMLCAFHKSHKQCDVFNLGNKTNINVTTIAKIVVEEMGLTNVRFKYTGGERGWPGDVPIVHFNLSKIGKLGWAPRYSSTDAVRLAARRLLGKEG